MLIKTSKERTDAAEELRVFEGQQHYLNSLAGDEAFEPEEIRSLFSRPRLRLVEPLDENVSHRYRCKPVDLIRAPYQTPHLVVKIDDTIFTSVIGFLEKI
jgi:hypothetical protein